MKAKHLLILITLLIGFGTPAAGQEPLTNGNKQDSSQRRLFPSQRDRRLHEKDM